jgi:hypothetical protein
MNHRVYVASFATADDLLQAIAAVRQRNWPIVEAYAPYPVHGLDQALGLPRSQLGKVCFLFGLAGVALALGFQFWASARDWPLNVGGQPWNSLPAFVPVTFESMVLCAGLGLVLTWLIRSGLYPGKKPSSFGQGETNDRFVLVIGGAVPTTEVADVRPLLEDHRAISLEEKEGG